MAIDSNASGCELDETDNYWPLVAPENVNHLKLYFLT